jgi:acyl-CoA thioesterase-1
MVDLGLFRFSTARRSSAVVLLSILLLFGCEQAPTSSPAPPPSVSPRDGFGQRLGTDVTAQPGRAGAPPSVERPLIVAFGDSLTAGLGLSAEQAYPAQLQRRLDAAGLRYRVVNAGVSGDTTAGGLRRLAWVVQSKPALVILELGGNDGLRGLSLAETRSNLEQMIRRLQKAGAHVVLAGMKLPPNYGADYTAQFETLYRDLAKAYRVPLIPFFLEGVAAQPSLNQADGIHPTAEGYHQVVENVMKTIEPLLRSPRLS